MEAVENSKKTEYEKYIKSIKDIADSKEKSDQVKVATTSNDALYEIVRFKEYYQETKNGDDYLEKLKEEAIKNLNSSLNFLFSNGISKEHFEEVRYFAYDDEYVNNENIALYEKEKEKLDNFASQERQEQREALGEVQTGYSEREVKVVLGSPTKVTKSNEAEFWTYDDVVLTMKNGYVYDIVYSNE
ncbi:hypothetical protein ACIQXF_06550 [Lysinibacillus sp. NPDC097231]|uniref:hypothetical protein n=1 Tax=Lysinibacillus sp. NPDC097231 TaxID=3364142 RepID=UPI003816FAA2